MSQMRSPDRLAAVRARIAKAAAADRRPADAVTLIAVSKTFAPEQIEPVLDAGHRVFGENRVQEAQAKYPALREAFPDLALHLIGPLQTNKVKDAVALFDVIENALHTKTKSGCAFINASLEINRPGHAVREAALAHLRAREGLIQQLLSEAGVEDAELAAQVTLLVDGAYATGGSRRDPAAARHAKAAAAALLASRVVS